MFASLTRPYRLGPISLPANYIGMAVRNFPTMTLHAVSTAQRIIHCYARFFYHVSVPTIYSMFWLLLKDLVWFRCCSDLAVWFASRSPLVFLVAFSLSWDTLQGLFLLGTLTGCKMNFIYLVRYKYAFLKKYTLPPIATSNTTITPKINNPLFALCKKMEKN